MILRRLVAALAVCAVVLPASGEDLLAIYRDARVSDPVYQAARQQYAATREKIPQALRVWLRYRSEKYFGEHRTPPGKR